MAYFGSACRSTHSFWEFPAPARRLIPIPQEEIIHEGDLCFDFPISQVSSRHVILTRTSLCYTAVSPTQSLSDLRLRRSTPIVLAHITPFHDPATGTGFRVQISSVRYIDLFAANWLEVETWLAALAQVACFTDLESDYKVGSHLGTGSSSRVYAGVELATGRRVAIKRMAKSGWQGMPERMVREVEILRKLKGEAGVVALQAVYEDYKDVCLVLNLEEGASLKRFLSKHHPLPEDQMRTILLNLLTILAAVHSQGIIHRDIKPDNIMVDSAADFTCCLLDFGLAIHQHDMNKGPICGTPGYIAPEILRGETGDERMDVYGLGMVGWTMVRGKNPFSAGDRRETLYRNREGMVQADWWDGTETPLKDFLEKMTSPDPISRPTASECLQHPWLSGKCTVPSCDEKLLSRLSSMNSDFSTAGEDRPPVVPNRD